ncbi:MAG: alginate lyase family protein, partial [Gammaproteobacteria bacterium]|nr:alginate lyase family protein [Gammaproteobacteria bacterium]
VAAWRTGLRFETFLPPPEPAPEPGRIRFVGLPRPFDPARPDWQAADAPKLWRYNLHYFDFLGWEAFPPEQKRRLVADWIARVPVGATDAWEPYTLSLRIVNWCKYQLESGPGPGGGGLNHVAIASLAHQAAALEGDLEYHLLANHLLKNGKALAVAGLCLDGPAADRWLATGLGILVAEARAQVLPDGGHVERSPMYHCIVLEDYLDVVNLLARNPGRADAATVEVLADTARRAAVFLRTILTGAGTIPLFNDAAHGITAPPGRLLAYASRVLGPAAGLDVPLPDAVRIDLPDSGFYGGRQGGDSLIVDCGPVGPDYQPGHTHCDTLSFELHVAGVPVVVDSGTFDYEGGPFRHYLRSTAAHNTVRIDGEEQSEIWGQFRVARRARPVSASFQPAGDGGWRFAGSHDGYRRLPGAPVHAREIRHDGRGRWLIRDTVTGAGSHRVESFLHLHPAVTVERRGEREFRLVAPGVALRLAFGPTGRVLEATGYHCPRFGERLPNRALVLEHTGPLPVELTCGFERL